MAFDPDSEGLLDGLEGGERKQRIELLRHLMARGVTPAELRGAAAAGRLVILAIDLVIAASTESMTPAEVAARSGLDVDLVERLRR